MFDLGLTTMQHLGFVLSETTLTHNSLANKSSSLSML